MTFPRTLIAIASVAVALAAALTYTTSAEARWFGRRHHDPGERAQRAVLEIVERAYEQLADLDLDPGEMHGELLDALSGDTVDRDALEALRAARLHDAETVTQVLLDAIADAAEVLTPEQRAQLPELAGDSHGHARGHGWGHRRHGWRH